MLIARTITDFRAWRRSLTGALGLVPTMGYLHEGHLSLARASKRDCDYTAATIFVNPAQFAPTEDLDRYPRDEDRDLRMLEAEGVDAVFIPAVEEMYPQGFSTYVIVEKLTERLEGVSRPAHFRGVTTVVMKLLQIAQPDRAYFGRKDAQQLIVVRRMVSDLDVPVEILGMPIVRESDGLAMSSRNIYLTPQQRRAALVLNRSLRDARQRFDAGEHSAANLRAGIEAMIRGVPLAEIDYVSIADLATLDEITMIDHPALVSLAVRFGQTRLIDNTVLSPASSL
jgi:pantoate--beta-alanine ligase